MKAQSLWAGHDYAHIAFRGRGQTYDYRVERVRVVRLDKTRLYGNTKETTFVTVQRLDMHDGSVIEEETEKKVRARDIVDFWDDWWAEYEEQWENNKIQIAEREKRYAEQQEEMRRRRVEREAEEAERRAKLQMHRNAVRQALHNKGLVFDDEGDPYYREVVLNEPATSVTIRGKELLRWLGIEENVQSTV